MKIRLRFRLKKRFCSKMKKKKSSSTFRWKSIAFSNNMSSQQLNDGSGDEREKIWRTIPSPVNEQRIANAQMKVDRLMNLVNDTYEKTLMRNLHLEDLDSRSNDLFRDAEKMKNMAHKMHEKFFWQDSKSKCESIRKNFSFFFFRLEFCLVVAIASVSAIVLGGLFALVFIPKVIGK